MNAFWWFKGDLISQWIPKFYLCEESNPINPQCGKYLLISIYPLPTHPTHNFTHKKGGNLDTLPGWPKKLHPNRPARCACQLRTSPRWLHRKLSIWHFRFSFIDWLIYSFIDWTFDLFRHFWQSTVKASNMIKHVYPWTFPCTIVVNYIG